MTSVEPSAKVEASESFERSSKLRFKEGKRNCSDIQQHQPTKAAISPNGGRRHLHSIVRTREIEPGTQSKGSDFECFDPTNKGTFVRLAVLLY